MRNSKIETTETTHTDLINKEYYTEQLFATMYGLGRFLVFSEKVSFTGKVLVTNKAKYDYSDGSKNLIGVSKEKEFKVIKNTVSYIFRYIPFWSETKNWITVADEEMIHYSIN